MNTSQYMDKQIMDLSNSQSNKNDFIDLINPQEDHHIIGGGGGGKKEDIILPSYDFQPIRPLGASQPSNLDSSNVGGPRVWTSADSKINSAIRNYGSLDSIESGKVILEKDRNVYDADLISEIDRTMKKHADDLLHALEGVSARLTQLESRTRHIENSVDDLKVSVGTNHGSIDGKMRQLEIILREVQTDVQVVRDKQEIVEAQLQLTKLQVPKVEQQSATQNAVHMESVQQAASAPQQFHLQLPHVAFTQPPPSLPPPNALPPPPQQNLPPSAQLPNQFSQNQFTPSPLGTLPGQAPEAPKQHYQPLPPEAPKQQYQPLPPEAPKQQYQPLPLPQQLQPPPPAPPQQQYQPLPHPQYSQPPPPESLPLPQYSQPPPPESLPLPQYSQPPPPESLPLPQYSQPPPPPQQHPSFPAVNPAQPQPPLGHHPEETPYIPSQNYPPTIRQPPSHAPSGAPPSQQFYGTPSHMYEPPSSRPISGFSATYGSSSGTGEPFPYSGSPSQYGSGSPMKSQQLSSPAVGQSGGSSYPQLPAARILPHALPTASGVGSGSGSTGGNRVPIDDVVDKVTSMGFSRDQVRATVRKLTENGQSVDLNVVLDKLMNDGEGQPQRAWFGR